MFEDLVRVALLVAGLYLLAGALIAGPVLRRGLAAIDPATARAGWPFKAVITPGLITFWPLVLLRWRQAGQGQLAAGGVEAPVSPPALRRLQGIVTTALLLITPAILASAVYVRAQPPILQNIPFAIIPDSTLLQYGGKLGRIFPSLPATVYMARDTSRRYGLEFRFDAGRGVPPAALYWSNTPGSGDTMPADAIFVGMVWQSANLWRRFPRNNMASEGYWLLYYFSDHTVESFPATQSTGQR